jgi:hypothetical protein
VKGLYVRSGKRSTSYVTMLDRKFFGLGDGRVDLSTIRLGLLQIASARLIDGSPLRRRNRRYR